MEDSGFEFVIHLNDQIAVGIMLRRSDGVADFLRRITCKKDSLGILAQCIAQFIKETDPKAKVVCAGPCMAKKMEQFREDSSPYIDCMITFEELQALIDAKEIDLKSLEESPLDNASYYGRIFARSGGLSDAVKEGIKEQYRQIR